VVQNNAYSRIVIEGAVLRTRPHLDYKTSSRVNRCAIDGYVNTVTENTIAKEIESTGGTTNSVDATIAKTNFCGYIPPAPLDGVRAMQADACMREDGVVNSIVPVIHRPTVASYSDNV